MVTFKSLDDSQVAALLQDGKVGVLPTDTVYGLACLASDQAAVARLYALKGREDKPGTLIAANIDQLVELGIPRRYLTAVEHFWPSPISIIVPTTPELRYLDFGKLSLAMRIPSDPSVARLLGKSGPLLTTSANQPGEEPAANVQAAEAYFGDTVDFYVDGGDLSGRPASTIIRIIDDAVEVVRQGAVYVNEKGEIEK